MTDVPPEIYRQPTVAPTNKSITAVYGQPLTLTMEFCANPRTIRPGDADKTVIAYGITVSYYATFLESRVENSTEPNCHQAVLFLTKVTNADIGEYSFLVRSPNGLSEGNFHVNLTYASGYNGPLDEESASEGTSHVFASVYINVIVLMMNYCYY
ncbi:hypothetical protein NQ315_006528 [Exocentrus adspersus]|uniref:Signal sequence receptor subunit alpha n=1 Tax=Exocentrus adspersus TaxID=1586481 RepID=A0AAV8W0G7_9CUCU|nr:hypothetical protein NQ315_006528 [Exocentrus adspersus]